jgi:beta-lactam-binding protein with PASTA domain
VSACPSCGYENVAGAHFCESCGEYLRWEPTRIEASVSAAAEETPIEEVVPEREAGPGDPSPEAAPARATRVYDASARPPVDASPEQVVVALRLPDVEAGATEEVTAEAEPGGEAKVLAFVRNQSGIVDNYDVIVEGLPDGWWTVTPARVYLVPFGAAAAGFEQEVEVRLHPPRSAQAEARAWPFRVAAISKAREAPAAAAGAALLVRPYHDLDTEMRPERNAGRLKARFAIAVRNRANAHVAVAVSAVDAENRCRFDFDQPEFRISPGRRGGTVFYVRPLKQIWIGRRHEHRFTVTPMAVAAEATGLPRQGVFNQRAWIPTWVPLVAPLVAGAVIAVFLLLPHTTTVPDLTGADSVIAAARLLEQAGLKLGDKTEKPTDRVRPGHVTAQSVPAGKKVDKGTAVAIEYAVGTGKTKVPRVVGMTIQQADTALRRAALTLGQPTPPSTDPQAKIAGQSPPAGDVQAEGTPVDVFLATEKSAAAGKSAGGTVPKGSIAVPALASLTGSAIANAVAAKGLVPNVVSQFNAEVPYGHVVSQTPAPGTKTQKGVKVTIVVSAGFPDIAYDDGRDVFLMGGAHGKRVVPLAASTELEAEPSVNPTGTLIAYWRGMPPSRSRIWVVNPSQPQTAHPITPSGFFEHRPAFSPNGKVIAFIRDTTDAAGRRDSDLCFTPTGGGAVSCITDPATIVDRPAWAPDGHAILVLARAQASQGFELGEYTSSSPSSANASDWQFQGLVSEKLHTATPGASVWFAAWAPNGKRVAFSANWESGAYHLFTAAVLDDTIGKPTPFVDVRACELAWRSDSRELAIVQSDADCSRAGVITRVDPTKPDKLVPVKSGVENPAWSPVGRRR